MPAAAILSPLLFSFFFSLSPQALPTREQGREQATGDSFPSPLNPFPASDKRKIRGQVK